MFVSATVNQKLEQRSSLIFEFHEGDSTIVRRVPFFENPSIHEDKRANYIKYAPLGRSSPLFSYFGSDPRIFDVEFNITLPHIIEIFSKDLVQLTFPLDTRDLSQLQRSDFINKVTSKTSNPNFGNARFRSMLNSADINTKEFNILVPEIPVNQTPNSKLRKTVIDIIMYWVNLIRASVVNNASTVKDGPPIVRLNHGIMYADIPCICFNYDMKFEENAGYDRDTLLPRLIKINLQLAEIRQGDFGKYEAATPIKRDNIVGWETIIKSDGSMSFDPIPVYKPYVVLRSLIG